MLGQENDNKLVDERHENEVQNFLDGKQVSMWMNDNEVQKKILMH